MHVVVFGGTGAIGRQLVPLLRGAGHEVTAVSRSTARHAHLEGTGARRVIGDLLDAPVVAQILTTARPDAVVHIATALPDPIDPRHPDRDFATTNKLRTEGTRNLLAVLGRLGGQVRLVTQGVAFLYEPDAGLADESAPFWTAAPKKFRPVVAALAEQDRLTREAGGVSLRFGHLYGPGTSFDTGGSVVANVKNRKMPLAGGGNSVFSFTHTEDAAAAILAAVTTPGIEGSAFNVVDDRPLPLSEWLPAFAQMLDARPPQKVPAAVAKMAAGGWGVAYLNQLRGASNQAARGRLGWEPRYRSWYEGIRHDLGLPEAGAGQAAAGAA